MMKAKAIFVSTILVIIFQINSNAWALVTGSIYWTSMYGNILRASSDGSNVEEVIAGTYPRRTLGIAADSLNNKIYWTEDYPWNGGGAIMRANLDGSGIEELIHFDDGSYALRIALDVSREKMYWNGTGLSGIWRANLDGTNFEEVRPTSKTGGGIALDLANEKIYWGEHDNNDGIVKRANFDGSNEEILFEGLYYPDGINGGAKVYHLAGG